MTPETVRAALRLGVKVYYRSLRTGRAWEILPEWAPKSLGGAWPLNTDRALSSRQVAHLIQTKPEQFTTETPNP